MEPDSQNLALDIRRFPGIFRALDGRIVKLQRRFRAIGLAQILLFVLASLLSLTSIRIATYEMSLLLASLVFASALLLQVIFNGDRIERTVKDLRRAAETIRSLTWRYAVGGKPFDQTTEQASSQFVSEVQQTIFQYRRIPRRLVLDGTYAKYTSVTPAMVDLRAAPLEARKTAYFQFRLKDQMYWFQRKATRMGRQLVFWNVLAVLLQSVVIVGLLLRGIGIVRFDLYSLASALGAAGATYSQNMQFSRFRDDYEYAAQRLTALYPVFSEFLTESDWSQRVDQLEALLMNVTG